MRGAVVGATRCGDVASGPDGEKERVWDYSGAERFRVACQIFFVAPDLIRGPASEPGGRR
jgi:hypothetical protein